MLKNISVLLIISLLVHVSLLPSSYHAGRLQHRPLTAFSPAPAQQDWADNKGKEPEDAPVNALVDITLDKKEDGDYITIARNGKKFIPFNTRNLLKSDLLIRACLDKGGFTPKSYTQATHLLFNGYDNNNNLSDAQIELLVKALNQNGQDPIEHNIHPEKITWLMSQAEYWHMPDIMNRYICSLAHSKYPIEQIPNHILDLIIDTFPIADRVQKTLYDVLKPSMRQNALIKPLDFIGSNPPSDLKTKIIDVDHQHLIIKTRDRVELQNKITGQTVLAPLPEDSLIWNINRLDNNLISIVTLHNLYWWNVESNTIIQTTQIPPYCYHTTYNRSKTQVLFNGCRSLGVSTLNGNITYAPFYPVKNEYAILTAYDPDEQYVHIVTNERRLTWHIRADDMIETSDDEASYAHTNADSTKLIIGYKQFIGPDNIEIHNLVTKEITPIQIGTLHHLAYDAEHDSSICVTDQDIMLCDHSKGDAMQTIVSFNKLDSDAIKPHNIRSVKLNKDAIRLLITTKKSTFEIDTAHSQVVKQFLMKYGHGEPIPHTAYYNYDESAVIIERPGDAHIWDHNYYAKTIRELPFAQKKLMYLAYTTAWKSGNRYSISPTERDTHDNLPETLLNKKLFDHSKVLQSLQAKPIKDVRKVQQS